MKTIAITSHTRSKQHILNEAYTKSFNTDTTTSIIVPIPEVEVNEILGGDSLKRIRDLASSVVEFSDALVVSGGNDINPVTFGKKNKSSVKTDFRRDICELELIEAFIDKSKPVIGIC